MRFIEFSGRKVPQACTNNVVTNAAFGMSLSDIISKTYAIFPSKISFEFNLGNPLPSIVIKYRNRFIIFPFERYSVTLISTAQ